MSHSPPPSSRPMPQGRFSLAQAFQMALERQTAGEPTAALLIYEDILKAIPDQVESLHNVGSILLLQQRRAEAETVLRRCLALRPTMVSALNNLSLALQGLGRGAEALAVLRRLLAVQPADAGAWEDYGRLIYESSGAAAAQVPLERALRLAVTAERCNKLGATHRIMARPFEAHHRLVQAVRLDPAMGDAWSNLGSTLRTLGEIDGALRCFDHAIRLKPDSAGAHWNRTLVLLLAGRFAEGWAAYDWRWRLDGFPSPKRSFPQPAWTGQPLAGKRLLVYWEQGFGDTIQFARVLPLVKALGAHVVFECQGPLYRLFTSLDGVDELVRVGTPLPAFDYHVALLSLPRLLGLTSEAAIPRRLPYLAAPAPLAAEWRDRLRPDDALRIGLVWAGSAGYTEDIVRSPRLAAFRPLLETPGVRCFGLQVGDGRRELDQVSMPAGFIDLGGELGDFADTAAAIAGLDLIVTCDTAVLHLAGALDKPAWAALPFAPDWRWLRERDDSPWYPSVRLFRQDRPGSDWQAVITRITAALGEWAARHKS